VTWTVSTAIGWWSLLAAPFIAAFVVWAGVRSYRRCPRGGRWIVLAAQRRPAQQPVSSSTVSSGSRPG
jgi:hypothetical protein